MDKNFLSIPRFLTLAKTLRVLARRAKHAGIRFWSGQAGRASPKTHDVVLQRGKHVAIRFWAGREWVFRTALSALTVLTINFVWAHWQTSTKVALPQGVWANI